MKTTIRFLKSKAHAITFIILLISAGISSCKKDYSNPGQQMPGTTNYSGNFVKSTANVTTSASGTTTATFDPATRALNYTLTWTGLSTNAIEMHFHDNVAGDGKIIIEINGFPKATSGTVSGKATLTADQANDLAAGKLYTQIHTENYPDGEILATLAASGNTSNPPSNPPGY